MSLFKVIEKGIDKPRMVEAKSREAALAFVTAPRFTVDLISKPSDVAKLMADGVTLEDANAPAVQAEAEQKNQQQSPGAEADKQPPQTDADKTAAKTPAKG